MDIRLKLTAMVALLAILLWIALYTFLNTTSLGLFGITLKPSSSSMQTSATQAQTAAEFKAYEQLKAVEEAQLKLAEQQAQESIDQLGEDSEEVLANDVATDDRNTTLNAQTRQHAAEQIPNAMSLIASSSPSASSPSAHIPAIEAVLSVENSLNCEQDASIELLFRENSASMRGSSMLALDSLIRAHKKCYNSVFLLKNRIHNESAIMLGQRRSDEVKYYLLQKSVDKSAIKLK